MIKLNGFVVKLQDLELHFPENDVDKDGVTKCFKQSRAEYLYYVKTWQYISIATQMSWLSDVTFAKSVLVKSKT